MRVSLSRRVRHARLVLLAAQTTMSYRRTRPLVPFLRPNVTATFRLQKARGLVFCKTPMKVNSQLFARLKGRQRRRKECLMDLPVEALAVPVSPSSVLIGLRG